MFYGILADAVVLVHAAFVAYVVLGGLLVGRWPRSAWGHVPCLLWGALVEFAGWVCPLTPLENWLRLRSGESSYPGDFLGRYLLSALYPDQLPRPAQVSLGLAVLAVNAGVYAFWALRRRRGHSR